MTRAVVEEASYAVQEDEKKLGGWMTGTQSGASIRLAVKVPRQGKGTLVLGLQDGYRPGTGQRRST